MSFRQALADNPAPAKLGDVSLRYEPSILVGETRAGHLTWKPPALSALGGGLVLAAVAALVFVDSLWSVSALLSLAAAAFLGSVRLSRLERRKRGFVVNFATTTLRLDFVTPLAGKPRTLLVPFDDVKAVGLVQQADGRSCLTIDFVMEPEVLREALAAFITDDELVQAHRLVRVLEGAFGLGSIPPDSPYLSTQSPAGPAGFEATPADRDGFDREP
ncbi:MAG: hypothetical protein Q8S33_18445 [Myxococcales bacterium]|nr:hypothetical protein [Myxococcales bacterium]